MPSIQDFIEMLKKSHSSPPRQYGDVRITQFECGCVLAAATSAPMVTEIKTICGKHEKFLKS